MTNSDLSTEWKFLQTQFDDYEKTSLLIKLFAVAVTCFSFISKIDPWFSALLILILWFQDGIWKTFQGRIESRLLTLETAIENNSDLTPYQFNKQWQQSRPALKALILEYVKHSLKPTVAYPYLLLILLGLLLR